MTHGRAALFFSLFMACSGGESSFLLSRPKEAIQPASKGGAKAASAWTNLPQCKAKRAKSQRPAGKMVKSLDQNVVRRVMSKAVGTHIVSCYHKHLHSATDLQGRWELRLIVGTAGSVQQAGVTGYWAVDAAKQGRTNPAFESCVKKSLCAITFPARKSGADVKILYPLHLHWAL